MLNHRKVNVWETPTTVELWESCMLICCRYGFWFSSYQKQKHRRPTAIKRTPTSVVS